ncbi:contact-dependent growth inhibition system immunity protein [Pantoea sp. A4]|uniref:contact-dependent growth inhibition system immunity protein n=1 Tax=Pantoea sp. A4 TaxID=1225184 RepID=UPI0003761925|nr:contact-dependent growth inhibition system immunity protein [Pantoea sp. A4]
MKAISISELDDLIKIYFGQDHDLIVAGTDIIPKIDAYIASTHKGQKHALIDDIDLFRSECDDLEKDFEQRYEYDFGPELWGTTATAFLTLVREKVSCALAMP